MKLLIIKIVFLIFSISFCYSCIEDYKINLNISEKIVINGFVCDKKLPNLITINKIVDYYDSDTKQIISDAIVIIKEVNSGHEEQLFESEKGSGVYLSSTFLGEIGNEYVLSVIHEGTTYNSNKQILPEIANFKLKYFWQSETSLLEEGYYVYLINDSINTNTDYYRIKVYKNNKLIGGKIGLIVRKIKHYKNYGEAINYPFSVGDSVRIEVLSLTEEAYNFYKSIESTFQISEGTFTPPPIPPSSNFDNDALGFFHASAMKKYEIIIK